MEDLQMQVVLLRQKVDDALIRRIVRAIEKTVADDIPTMIHEHPLETTNYIRILRTDYINENLKSIALGENIKLIKFKRFSWYGCMLVDLRNHTTYTITTKQNLKSIPKKKERKSPHFLMSILAVENEGLHGQHEPQSLFPMYNCDFDKECYEKDYNNIVNGVLNPQEDYRHFIISYEFSDDILLNVDLLLLDKNFYEVEKRNLNEYIKPDFAKLTNLEITYSKDKKQNDTNRKVSLSLKPNVGLPLNLIQKDESIESVRKNE